MERGSQYTGLLPGKKDLIDAPQLNNSPFSELHPMIHYVLRCVPLLLFLPLTLAQDSPPPGSPAMTFRVYAEVEEKARLLRDDDQDTHRALADTIFKASRGFAPLTV